ncbi:MAG: hypothetical protein JEZ14_26415 [Marinilabiliaceae bacterium]|nr:hypothetical protein [Marinilabiliaceae bacterium]
MENAFGSAVFEDAFQFSAVQTAPTELRYLPSLYSFYGSEIGNATQMPLVKGGGPFTFSMDDPIGTFSIDETSGIITKVDAFEVGDDDKIIKTFDVGVANEKGDFLAEDVVTIQLLEKVVVPALIR